MYHPLTHVEVGPTSPVTAAEVLRALRSTLDGTGPALAPYAAGAHRAPDARSGVHGRVPEDVALVVRTSGSTGAARGVLLERAALTASAAATHRRLGGAGRWILALPLTHIAGLQVLVRSVVSGTEPLVVAAGSGPATLAAAVERHPGGVPLYTALVPTQLHRALTLAGPGADLPPELAPLRRLDAILVGGAATTAALLDRARDQGLHVVTTYGMTETSGGCVYDGVPLDGVEIDLDAGTVRITGPVLARGYLDGQDDAFVEDAAGRRWFCTQDLGAIDDSALRVTGRRDDIVVTGGEKVAPAAVEAVLAGVPGVARVCVVGVPDAEWGQLLTAVVVPDRGPGASPPPTLEQLRAEVGRSLWVAAAPRRLLLVDALPERGPGKVDRAEVTRRATHEAMPVQSV